MGMGMGMGTMSGTPMLLLEGNYLNPPHTFASGPSMPLTVRVSPREIVGPVKRRERLMT